MDAGVTCLEGVLQVDHVRGVVYFHSYREGITKLRICKLGKIPENFTSIDMINKHGSVVYV